MLNEFVITLDIDWAPDFVIDSVAKILKQKEVRATWFVTHSSPAIDRLRKEQDLFELGLHPNFLPGSTQGGTPAGILANLLSIVPNATSLRAHASVQSGPLIDLILAQTSIKVDSTIFLPGMANICPVEYYRHRKVLLRLPFFWGDDHEMEKYVPYWHLDPYLEVEGLKIFNFHPINLYLNSSHPKTYESLKKRVKDLRELKAEEAEEFRFKGEGAQTLFSELLDNLVRIGQSMCLRDIYRLWIEEGSRGV